MGHLFSPPMTLQTLHQWYLSTILNIHLGDFVTIFEVLEKAKITSRGYATEIMVNAGPNTSLGGAIITCPGSYCALSFLLVISTERYQRNKEIQKLLEKNPLVPVTLTIVNGSPKLRFMMSGVSLSTMLSPPLKIYAGSLSITKTEEEEPQDYTLSPDQTCCSSHCNRACLSSISFICH